MTKGLMFHIRELEVYLCVDNEETLEQSEENNVIIIAFQNDDSIQEWN